MVNVLDDSSYDENVIALIFLHKELLVEAIEEDKLAPDYFEGEWGKIFSNCVAYFRKYRALITIDAWKDQLANKNVSSVEIGRQCSILNGLSTVPVVPDEYKYYVEMIKERKYNKIIHQAIDSANRMQKQELSMLPAADILLKAVNEIKSISSSDRIVRTEIAQSADAIKERYLNAKNHPEASRGIMTGFYKLDEITWGIRPGEVLLIAGPTGGGKSITLICMAAYIYNGIRYCGKCNFQLFRFSHDCPACGSKLGPTDQVKVPGKNVVYVSIEMPEEDCTRRFLSSSLSLGEEEIKRGLLGETEEKMLFKQLEAVKKNTTNGFYIIDVPRGMDVDFINAEIDKLESKSNRKMDVIIIDYMQLMKQRGGPYKGVESDWQTQTNIASEIHELARTREVPIISAVQTTSIRQLKSEAFRYGTHRVARAEGIAQNVNIILQIEDLIKDEKEQEGKISSDKDLLINYHIIKNRGGPRGVISMQKDFSKMQIYHVLDVKYKDLE